MSPRLNTSPERADLAQGDRTQPFLRVPVGQGPATSPPRPGPAAPRPVPAPRPASQSPLPPGAPSKPGTAEAPDEARIALLQDARAYLERPGLREAFRQFVRTAADLSKSGLVFEVVTRPDAAGATARHLPRHLTITTRPEPGLGEEESTVLLMGVGFWEFLPGRFQGSERVLDATRMAMDVGTFRFVENTPSGDAEIVGHEDGRPLAQYLRIEISGEGLEKSVAVSNTALGGAFVAAYRNYLEVLAERPYRSLHPYRQLGTPATPPPPRSRKTRITRRLAGPAASAPARPATGAPARARRQGGLRWAWLGAIPALGGAWLLMNLLVAPQQATEAPRPAAPPSAPPAPASTPPAPPAGAAARPETPAAGPSQALEPVPTIDLPPPLPLPPPSAPEPPAAAAPVQPAAPGPASLGRAARVRVDANVRAAPSGSAPVVRTVLAGTEVRIAGEEYGWQRVLLPNGTELGWIYGNLID